MFHIFGTSYTPVTFWLLTLQNKFVRQLLKYQNRKTNCQFCDSTTFDLKF